MFQVVKWSKNLYIIKIHYADDLNLNFRNVFKNSKSLHLIESRIVVRLTILN